MAAKVIRKQGAKDKVCDGSRALGMRSGGSAGSDSSAVGGSCRRKWCCWRST